MTVRTSIPAIKAAETAIATTRPNCKADVQMAPRTPLMLGVPVCIIA